MAQIDHQVNTDQQEQDRPAVPAGDYKVIIENSDYTQTSKGGWGIPLSYQIIEGPFKGYKLFEYINKIKADGSEHPIGNRVINTISVLTGIQGHLQDTSQWHNIPFTVKVNYISEEQDPQYGPKNEIKKHFAIGSEQPKDSNSGTDSPPVTNTAQSAPPEGKKTQPWDK